ncbi:MAG TPA: DUF1501 domain-containing protein [Planctomycetota bacterium]|nr:DUF1501 domain-containing protein [Planctomycetota bacterium]
MCEHDLIQQPSRRELLGKLACGFGSLALASMMSNAYGAEKKAGPLAPKAPHFAPKAKRIIFLFMQGGPSHIDTFDPKPKLEADDGKKVEFNVARTRKVQPRTVLKSPWKFAQYGQSGRWVSELFPETAKHVDKLCFIRSVHTEGVAHGPATLFLHTGATAFIRPSIGSWLTYGLGTENQNLPGFVTISPTQNMGGPRNYSNAFLPAVYQGTAIGRATAPATQVKFRHVTNELLPPEQQKKQFELLQALNREQARNAKGDDEVEAAINSFELAYRMQMHAPEVTDISSETPETLKLYGIGEKETDDYGRQCLIARRLCERGTRFVQVNYSDNGSNPRWDQHSNLKAHEKHARAVDKPVMGLLQDLEARGLLEDTLVWWGGEFGRTPFSDGRDGRDHNPTGFTVWLAGAGVKKGVAWGETDEYGFEAVKDKVHMHDLHATILHLFGVDHEKLTYRYAGRDFRLTDVAGHVVKGILS